MSPFYCYLPRFFFSSCTQAPLNWGKKDEPVYVTEESGVVGLNFHQSKEALIYDSTNGIANHYDVRGSLHITADYALPQFQRCTYMRFLFRFFLSSTYLFVIKVF